MTRELNRCVALLIVTVMSTCCCYGQSGMSLPTTANGGFKAENPNPISHASYVEQTAVPASSSFQGSSSTTTNVRDVRSSGFPSLAPNSNPVDGERKTDTSAFGPIVTTVSSLTVVLGLFAGFVWLTRRYGNDVATTKSVSDVIQNLGSTAIDPRTQITLLRCGNRILVLAQTANGVQPLSEIDDPTEVERLTAQCLGHRELTFAETMQSRDPGSASQSDRRTGFVSTA